jgi:polysaccharide pyruvyl transferase WcaK-like protein
MKIFVLHGSSGNFGDTAMLEGVVLNLLRNLSRTELFVTDQQGLRTNIWDLPRVHKQDLPTLTFPWEHSLAEVPYLWRYDVQWRRAVRKWVSLGLGRTFSSKAIRVSGAANCKCTLHELCARFDALHMVGGGYLTDVFPDQVVRFVCLARAFVEQDKPIVLTGQQVGPFRSRVLQTLTGGLLRGARFVGLREPTRSVELCQQFGLSTNNFRVMGDDSFGLICSSEAEILSFLAAHRLEPGRFLAFNVRVGPYAAEHGEHLRFIARLAEELARSFRLPIVMVPIAFNSDDSDDRSGEELMNLIQRTEVRRIDSRYLTPGLVRGLLGNAFGAIGVSYHFCTFALSQGVPAVCIYEGEYYSQKALGICNFWQDDRLAISLHKAGVSSTVERLSALLNDSHGRARLSERARFAIEAWRKTFDEQVQKNFGTLPGTDDQRLAGARAISA